MVASLDATHMRSAKLKDGQRLLKIRTSSISPGYDGIAPYRLEELNKLATENWSPSTKREVLLIRTKRSIASISNSCPHMNLPLEMGHISDEETIRCPFHDSEFCIKTGEDPTLGRRFTRLDAGRSANARPHKSSKVSAFFPCMEKNGYLWVSADE